VLPDPGLEAHPTENQCPVNECWGEKKVLLSEEERALLANPLLHSRKLKGYRQGRIKRERNS
jgi:hypothetical protein